MTQFADANSTVMGKAGRTALWVSLLVLVIVGAVLYVKYANAVTPLVGTSA